MEALANAKEWTKIGKILGEKCFTGFSDTAYILTKSEVVTAEDKVALGTIKRYGTVAGTDKIPSVPSLSFPSS